MIRGPVLPQQRDGLWSLVVGNLEALEKGLSLVLEGLDCSNGNLGTVDGLARDAAGAPVLLMVAADGDGLLPARVLAAHEFLRRVGGGLAAAVPEAGFAVAAVGRLVVIGTETTARVLEALQRLAVPSLETCHLEPFRIAGRERFAVRWEGGSPADGGAAGPRFTVPVERLAAWEQVARLCARVDSGVRVDGDRFWRRVTWHGKALGQLAVVDGELFATSAAGERRALATPSSVRWFGDQVLRRYAALAGLTGVSGATADAANDDSGPDRLATLRATIQGSRLTPEEYSALGGPVRMAGGETEVAGVAGDAQRSVAGQDSPWVGPTLRSD